jgi:hypothetical protein
VNGWEGGVDLPPAFEAALASALSREPDERPSISALAELFQSILATPAAAEEQPGPDHSEAATMPTVVAWPPDRDTTGHEP